MSVVAAFDPDVLATKADLVLVKTDLAVVEARMSARLYRALFLQTIAILAANVALIEALAG